ncbi:alpha/beta fold hydrolase [Mesorhizobium sp. M7A.F.Ca.US.011.01.1.1]|uniref:alpha/beta hydrolase n=1 Tax=Mesorhizobium sp. M7A.F.Ca.US.011.01.1.1 TaxID=2496741 RepID=UPI000FCC8FD0|nr:alpha/beta hydrolase [Mesorhizobium sp. M7A.F.Ca.US.011.01.1.1]RUX28853.1 alpha/beta fold hydrolase [Mesorhizobium sp. M7A.F.Ca.US.011.01.1.1]
MNSALLALAFVGLLSGCATRPTNVLLPVADTSPSSSKIEMLVTTTRRRSANPAEMYTGERGTAPSFADITVSIPPASVRKAGEVAWPKKLPSNPATDFAVVKAEELTLETAKGWLHASVRKTPDHSVLVFIHGFNNRFEDAVYRFAQIAEDTGTDSVPILVTWPSRGSALAYGYDRESTNYTRNALELLFQYLARDPEIKEVSILAHSMGNWLALESLRQMAIRNGGLPAKFKNVMLAAPDVDVDVFRTQIADMGKQHPQFTLFVSQDDRALKVSRRVWGNIPRLGSIDPEQAPYKEELASENVTVIDLTKIKSGDRLNHGKFASSPQIVQLIGARMAGGQTLTDNRIGLGDTIVQATTGAAAAAGSAAGLMIAAPVAMVDQNTRENYGNEVEALTGPQSSQKTNAGGKNCALPAPSTRKCKT